MPRFQAVIWWWDQCYVGFSLPRDNPAEHVCRKVSILCLYKVNAFSIIVKYPNLWAFFETIGLMVWIFFFFKYRVNLSLCHSTVPSKGKCTQVRITVEMFTKLCGFWCLIFYFIFVPSVHLATSNDVLPRHFIAGGQVYRDQRGNKELPRQLKDLPRCI